MPKYTDDEDFSRKETGFTRLGDGVRSMDLTQESRIPADLMLFHKLDEVLVEMRKTNQYLSKLTNDIY